MGVWLAAAVMGCAGSAPPEVPAPVVTAAVIVVSEPAASASAAAAAPGAPPGEVKRRWALDHVGKLSGDGLKLRVFWDASTKELKALRAQYDQECQSSGDKVTCTAAAAIAEQLGQTMHELEPRYVAMCQAGEMIACARLALYWPCHHPDRGLSLTHRLMCEGLVATPEHLAAEGKAVDKQRPALAGARALGVRACDAGIAAGCVAAAASFEPKPSDVKRAVELYRRGCELGSWMGCKRAFEVGRDEAAAKKQLDLALAACDGGDGTACAYAGGQRAAGAGVPRDAAAARALYQRACEKKVSHACDDLARMEREK